MVKPIMSQETELDITVTTQLGRIRGRRAGVVDSFLGIPFAEAPVGPLRFASPRRRRRSDELIDATSHGPAFPQTVKRGPMNPLGRLRTVTDIDSLRLNIWSPAAGARGLPVLVWIHGGGWGFGSGNEAIYDGTRLAERGIVVVTVNYRLGIEGFLHLADILPDAESEGNYGLLDQISALEWVQENIASFGGDPTKVTVAGQSAGAMSVGMLLGSPLAGGLFRRAIMQSGSVAGLSRDSATGVANEVLGQLHRPVTSLDDLREITVDELLKVHDQVKALVGTTRDWARFGEAARTGLAFQPVYGTHAVPMSSLDAIATGAASGIDLLIGTTSEEYLALMAAPGQPVTDESTRAALAHVLKGAEASSREVVSAYRVDRADFSSLQLAAAIDTDRVFRLPAKRFADAHVAAGGTAWMYEFDWRSRAYPAAEGGAFHLLDVPFVFGTLDDAEGRAMTGPGAPRELSRVMGNAWMAFVEDGVPRAAGMPEWSPYTDASVGAMRFGEKVERFTLIERDEQRKLADVAL